MRKKACPKCKAENSVAARFCWKCWAAFDQVEKDDIVKQVIDELLKRSPEVIEEIIQEKKLAARMGAIADDSEASSR